MKTILIIEDNQEIAELERDFLEAAGITAEIAETGTDGLDRALHQDYDLVLLDIMLPGLDGFEVCRRLRAEKDVPILMVSAKREDIDKIRGLGLGADDYIIKPFSPMELVPRVKAHIARYERLTAGAQAANAAVIHCGNLTIETDKHRVFVGPKEVTLTHKDFELLVFLARNQGIVFSRERLFEKVWGYDAEGDTATVMVHINRIREKIEPDPSHPIYIETVWGAGYRMKEC